MLGALAGPIDIAPSVFVQDDSGDFGSVAYGIETGTGAGAMAGEKLTESEPIVKSGWEPLVGAVPFRVNCRSDMFATEVFDEISECISVVRLRVFRLIISSTRADAPPKRAEASRMFVSSGLVSR